MGYKVAGVADTMLERKRRGLGVLAGFALCGVYVTLEVAQLADGLLLYVPPIAGLVAARALEGSPKARRAGRWVALVVAGGCLPLAIAVWRLRIGVADISFALLTVTLVVATALGMACLIRPVRSKLLSPIGLDPDSAVHTVGALAFVLALWLAVGDFLSHQSKPVAATPVHATDPLTSFLGDTTLALAGVGFLQTRDLQATLTRLGLKRIGVRQLAWAVVATAILHAGIGLLELAEARLFPDLAALEDRVDYEFVNVPPILGAVLFSFAVGPGEELLFRGALQPRVGLVLTALIYAASHSQYQLPGIVIIFVLGMAFGWMKERTSTSFTAAVHTLYNLGAFFLPHL